MKVLDKDFVWEGDYGRRSHLIPFLKELLCDQDATSLQMLQVFTNSNPYKLEFFIVVSYKQPDEGHIEKMKKGFQNLDLVYRPDITMDDLLLQMGKRRFNSATFIDEHSVDLIFESLFEFLEKNDLLKEGFDMSDVLGSRYPIFLSHSSKNKPEIEELIPYITAKNIPVWFDKFNIDYGESLIKAIQKGIKDSFAAIFWITNEFIQSNWCDTELETLLNRFASKKNVLILPIVAHDVDTEKLELLLGNLKYKVRGKDESIEDVARDILPSIMRYLEKDYVMSNSK